MILTLVCALAWDLNSPIKAETKFTYAVSVAVQESGQEHHATFDFVIDSPKSSTGKFPLSVGMQSLRVDDNDTGEGMSFGGTYNENGFLATLDGDSPDFRRMFAPFFFPFPNKSVEEAASWKFESKEKGQIPITIDLTTKGTDSNNGVSTLIVKTQYAEGEGGTTKGDGTWWIGKDSRVQKFELKLRGWVVPMAGGEPVDASITGILRPAK